MIFELLFNLMFIHLSCYFSLLQGLRAKWWIYVFLLWKTFKYNMNVACILTSLALILRNNFVSMKLVTKGEEKEISC